MHVWSSMVLGIHDVRSILLIVCNPLVLSMFRLHQWFSTRALRKDFPCAVQGFRQKMRKCHDQ